MRRLLTCILALGALATVPSCSALGLDHLPQSDCTLGGGGLTGDAFCASLATLVPPSDSCHTWQCNAQSLHCEQQLRDDDGDGYPSMMCAGSATPDCDDADGDNFPTNPEMCDGRDENCNGIIDDGVIAPAASTITMIATPTGTPLFTMTDQPDVDEAVVMAGYEPSRFDTITIPGTGAPSTATLAVSVMGGATVTADAAGLAVAGLGGGHYVLTARVRTSMCQQWGVLPITSGASTITLRGGTVSPDQYLLGACPNTVGVTAPAVAGIHSATGDLMTVAWLEGVEEDRGCGIAPARPVHVSAASFDYRASGGQNRVSTDDVTLDPSVGDGAPAVLALDDAFVVAFPRADNTIAVHVFTVVGDATGVHLTPSTTMAPDYVEPAGTVLPQSVRLARATDPCRAITTEPLCTADVQDACGWTSATAICARTGPPSVTFALAYATGCDTDSAITVRLLTRRSSVLTAAAAVSGIGAGRGTRAAEIIYQPRASEWLVSYSRGGGQSAQRLHDDGTLEGDAFDIRAPTSTLHYLVEPLGTSGAPLYRAILADGNVLSSVTFGCALQGH